MRREPIRLLVAGACLAIAYALPLFWPPGGTNVLTPSDAPLLERLFPGVPAAWAAWRLIALAAAVVLLAAGPIPRMPWPLRAPSPQGLPAGRRVLRALALLIALAHVAAAPWAAGLGGIGQTTYLLALAAPASLLVLSTTSGPRLPRGSRHLLAPTLVILAWAAWCLARELGTPRGADGVDGWRSVRASLLFVAHHKNLLTDRLDVDMAGLGAGMLFFHGLPLDRLGMVPLTVRSAQVAQIVWLALTAGGLALLARAFVGPRAALVALAVFLFAPYTRFVSLLPGPFLLGPLYVTAMALCAVRAVHHRSEGALAALGALSGLVLTFPGAVPPAGFLVLVTLWQLRRSWHRLWLGLTAGLASFLAIVVPAVPKILTPDEMGKHLGLHGMVGWLEPVLLGQAPIGNFEVARAMQVWRPLDIVLGALLEPFANPRTAIRFWGDAIFDPVGAVLLGIGLLACARAARRSAAARFLLAFYLATLCPAFVSPVDRVDIVHAAAIAVPVALLAGTGFVVLRQRLAATGIRWRGLAIGTAALVAAGGTLLFDAVNPRILGASYVGVLLRGLAADDAERVVVLDYPSAYAIDVRFLFVGVMTAHAGERPLGYLQYGGGALPADDLAQEKKDLLAWSPGLEASVGVRAAVCSQWPGASLYELWDEARLSRAFVAQVGSREWHPGLPPSRWHRSTCGG